MQWDKLLFFFSCYLQLVWTLSLSGKLPELRPTGVSFDFKATLSLHSMLPSHAAFTFLLLDSPPPETLTSSLAMVHIRQHFQKFHAFMYSKFLMSIHRGFEQAIFSFDLKDFPDVRAHSVPLHQQSLCCCTLKH